MMPTSRRRLHTFLLVLALLMSASCSTHPATEESWNKGGDTRRTASSLTALVEDMLANDDMDQSQRDMLQRSLAHDGQVSRADYLTAWDNYRQCMVDRGYTAPPLQEFSGLYFTLLSYSTAGMSEAQQRQFNDDWDECYTRYVFDVDIAYRDSQGNPGLYGDSSVALLDCLHRRQLVPDDYDINQFNQEDRSIYRAESGASAELLYTFDLNDPQVVGCVVANIPALIGHRVPPWHPLG